MSKPDEEPTETPTTSREEATEEGGWMLRNWVAVAVVSVLMMLLLALGLMQWTGLVDILAPVADSEAGQWGVFAVLAIIVAALAVWGWSAFFASDR
ncbi:hypothetical protein [Natrononativus amylolyticus]|uniref:hypothetical protein n=1 Tax=Natrononativus amylolyticus TaxID=2963434 RepID=UPI0020CF64DE|nr:hypothetical protein [Natrononativus amylolyticus]